MARRHKDVFLKPPDDTVVLCPECGGTVVEIGLCNKSTEARLHPCQDLISADALHDLLRASR